MVETKKLFRVAVLSKRFGIATSTLRSAIRNGHLKHELTGCGLPLVSIAAVKAYMKKEIPGAGKPRTWGKKDE